jgi:hypothetical protein
MVSFNLLGSNASASSASTFISSLKGFGINNSQLLEKLTKEEQAALFYERCVLEDRRLHQLSSKEKSILGIAAVRALMANKPFPHSEEWLKAVQLVPAPGVVETSELDEALALKAQTAKAQAEAKAAKAEADAKEAEANKLDAEMRAKQTRMGHLTAELSLLTGLGLDSFTLFSLEDLEMLYSLVPVEMVVDKETVELIQETVEAQLQMKLAEQADKKLEVKKAVASTQREIYRGVKKLRDEIKERETALDDTLLEIMELKESLRIM